MLVFPAPGLRVRDPATRRFVPDEGLEISETDLTWARLLRDGDLIAKPADAKPAPPAPPPPPSSNQANKSQEPG